MNFTPKDFLPVAFLLIATLCRSQTDVLTQHNDYNRTGWNPTETILNTSNVTPTNFGILYKRTVDDQIFAQPLVVTGVKVTDPRTHAVVTRNVVYVATVKNTLYAFDADDGTLNPYWQLNFTPAGEVVPSAMDIHASLCGFSYTDFQGHFSLGQNGSFGIVGTPVIDKNTNTIYFVSRYRDPTVDNTPQGSSTPTPHFNDPDWSSAGFYQQFHALDLSTGLDKFGSPVLINPSTTFVNGTGAGNVNNIIYFDPRRQNQRGGLLISNGIVYIPYSGHCDMDNYHGWILGYKTDDLRQQLIRYVTTPNDERGGIWMSGAGPAADAAGNIYFATGNANNSSLASSPGNVGLSVVKTTPDLSNNTLTNVSWLKPLSYHNYNTSDLDFGTGLVLIPGTNMLVTAHKSGRLMVMKQNASPGEFNETSPNFLQSVDLGVGSSAQGHSSISYFGGATRQYIYQFSEYTHVMAYPVNSGLQQLDSPVSNTSVSLNTGMEGGYLSVSSNGTDPNSAILWVSQLTVGSGGTLHALKADDITQELWNSDGNPADVLGHYAKMSPVTIANGKVYAPTFSNSLNVYGLLESNSRCFNNVALNKTAYASHNTNPNLPASNAFDGNTGTRWAISGGTGTYIFVDLGARYDICKVTIQWNNLNDNAHAFTIDISDDTLSGWTTIDSVTNNIFTGNAPTANTYNEHSTGRYVRMKVSPGGAGTFGVSISEMQVFGSPANNCIPPDVTDLTASNITQNSATLSWMPVSGVTDYLVKYRPPTVSSYITRSVHDGTGSGNPLSLNVGGLTCGFTYEFDIQTVCGNGMMSAPSVQLFTTSPCSSPCLNLTRFYHGDLGDVQAPGMSCYSDPTFTVTGAGSGIGGSGDQFQFNYTSLIKDEEFIMRIASQDATFPASRAGIMMRDSVTDISRFIFVGKTGDNQLMFSYRATPGGMAVSMLMPNSNSSNYFRIMKAGSQYAAYYGNSVVGPWSQIGPLLDLGFGTQEIFIGMAVSSLNPSSTTTVAFDNLSENSTTLPIQLLNFTASDVRDEYIFLKWQTGMEENNDHFEVERSTDATNFDKILSVKAVGNSSVTQSYSGVDNVPVNGINFYRLKQVDLDGRFTYSGIQMVKFGNSVKPVIYPNPVSSIFTAVPGSELIREIVIYNVQGKAVQFAMGNSTAADMKVNVSLLPEGVYFAKVKTDSQVYQFKIFKQ
jgi:F5/8 type C domain/Secretion system C-terminal sorting domain/Fibronectin type III domain